ncbi:MAG: DUF2007 domain-containing protein [Planctomycetota bacterium]
MASEAAAAEPAAWCALVRVRHEQKAQILRGLLESAGIPCQVVSKALAEMPVPAATFLSYFEIWVRESDEALARQLIREGGEAETACPTCGHLGSSDGGSCEYCGTTRAGR